MESQKSEISRENGISKKMKKKFRNQKFQNSINVSVRQCQCQIMKKKRNNKISKKKKSQKEKIRSQKKKKNSQKKSNLKYNENKKFQKRIDVSVR